MTLHEQNEPETTDVVTRDREAWNLPAPIVSTLRSTQPVRVEVDDRVGRRELPELDPAA